jgi:sugar lactone lactonase YvrE
VDAAGDLFVGDNNNNRFLVYRTPLTTDTVADVVIGQPDFLHQGANALTAQTLSSPQYLALDTSSSPIHLYVTDGSNNRILGWTNALSFANGAAADLVIGEPDFSSNVRGTAANEFASPEGIAVDSKGNLYVADEGNNRVLEFNAPFTSCSTFPCIGGNANLVFGQLGLFTSGSCNLGAGGSEPSADTLCEPEAVAVDSAGNVYIADTENDRVLEYNTPLQASSEPNSGDTVADLVFGQGAAGNNFSAGGCNTTSATSLCSPAAIAIGPSNTVYITDSNPSRVLGYTETTEPPTNVTANSVFGESGAFNSGSSNCGAPLSGFCRPVGIALDSSGNLYVADNGNNRMIEFQAPFVSSPMPSIVWGQGGDLAASECNVGGSSPDAQTLCAPQAVAVTPANQVFIADTNNNRVLQYLPPFPPPGLDQQKPLPTPRGSLSVQSKPLRFGILRVGRTSKARVTRLVNDGPVPVSIKSIEVSPDFVQRNSCGSSIAVGSSCEVTISFRPISVDRRMGNLIITDDAQKNPQMVELRGWGERPARRR